MSEHPYTPPEDVAQMSIQEILTCYQDGDGIGWPAEFAWVRTYHPHRVAELTRMSLTG